MLAHLLNFIRTSTSVCIVVYLVAINVYHSTTHYTEEKKHETYINCQLKSTNEQKIGVSTYIGLNKLATGVLLSVKKVAEKNPRNVVPIILTWEFKRVGPIS